MLSAVKMEGHEAPDWSGFYSEEVGQLCTLYRRPHRAPEPLTAGQTGPDQVRFLRKVCDEDKVSERKIRFLI